MSPRDLSVLLTMVGISGRELARRLEVSPMWVSRRLRGDTPITELDEIGIRHALGVDTVPR